MKLVLCPACGESRESEVFTLPTARGPKPWTRCSACRSYFLTEPYDPEREVAHTETQPWGEAAEAQVLARYKKRMYHAVLDLLRSHRPPPATLLDVGCSYGGFLLEARAAGYEVTGIDIVPGAVSYLRAQGLSARVGSSVGELGAASFDVITCLDSNCYWPDQPRELEAIRDRLKPGSSLVMRVVDKSWMFAAGRAVSRVVPRAGERVMRKAVHDHRFSMPVASLLELLSRHGYEVNYAAPRGAVHSDETSVPVKLCFGLGQILWRATGRFVAPGALILATRSGR